MEFEFFLYFLGILNWKSSDKIRFLFMSVISWNAINLIISEPPNFDNAQITLGGVNTEEIDVNTLESKIVKGLYFSGEVIDIDGICGGYNLQLAYSTASIIAKVFKE